MKTVREHLLLFLWLVALFMPQISGGQENKPFANIIGGLVTYADINTPEKVYVHTDKDLYTNGETVWFRPYVLDGITHRPSNRSRVVYVELVSPKGDIVAQRKLYTGFDGGAGEIILPNEIQEGNHTLRAYTKYMLNERDPAIFTKDIFIQHLNGTKSLDWGLDTGETKVPKIASEASVTPEPTVKFFPEGGHLVAGLENVLGMKINDGRGNGLAIEGKIVDDSDSLLTMFRTYEFGLGRVNFKPEANTDYFAQLAVGGRILKYKIPQVVAKGYTLLLTNKDDHIQIRVSTNVSSSLKGALLLGHLRGKVILKHIIPDGDKPHIELKLFTTDLDNGIASFTLFTASGEPVCERLTFIDNLKKSVDLKLKTDKPNYGPREQVYVNLDIRDGNAAPLTSSFSIGAVTQNGLNSGHGDMRSWLLLNSDLGNTVENPSYFFESDSQNRKKLLDILMLTHGWRRFVWKELAGESIAKKKEFEPEKGIVISGSTTDFDNSHRPLKARVKLTVPPNVYEEEKATNAQGNFSLGPVIFNDSLKATIDALPPQEGSHPKKIAIYLDPPFPSIHNTISPTPKNPKPSMSVTKTYLEEALREKTSDFDYDPKVTKLKEVTVRETHNTRSAHLEKKLNSRTRYGRAQTRLFPDSIPNSEYGTVFDILYRAPGVQVFGIFPNQRAIIVRNSGENAPVFGQVNEKDPLYLLDGLPVSADVVQNLSAFDILFVDVLKSAGETAQYGVQGGNGVVAIYTRKGEDIELRRKLSREPNTATFIIPGFYKTREFYSPDHSNSKSGPQRPDYRTTLYWNPEINFTENVDFSFYTGNGLGTYTVHVEGISEDGRPLSGHCTFTVGKSVD